MKTRQKRRWLTLRAAKRSCRDHKRVLGRSSTWEFQVGKAKKRKALACPCTKKSKNNPKYGCGVCYACNIRPTVQERIYGRRLCHAWLDELAFGVDPLDIDPIVSAGDW